MISLTVGLTSEVIKFLIHDVTKYNQARDRLFQHKILRTDTLEDYYLESFDEASDKQAYRYWADILEREDKFKYFDIKSDNPIEEMNLQLIDIPHHICICNYENEIVTEEIINKITLERINAHGDYNELSKFCFPLIKIIRLDESIDEFLDWLKEILTDEPKVTSV